MMYLEDDVKEWAEKGLVEEATSGYFNYIPLSVLSYKLVTT